MPKNTRLEKLSAEFAIEMIKEFGHNADEMKQAHEVLARGLAIVIDSGPNAQLAAQVIDFCMDGQVQGPGVTEQVIADQHGLTRAAVSKRAVITCQELGLPPSRGMRTPAACKNYRMRQQGRRTVIQKRPWPFASMLQKAIS